MENQLTFADSEYSQKRRLTRKEKFLGRMEKLVPWIQIIDLIEPFYAKAGNGRRPYPLETMLRIHCLQQWYSLSDESMEDALYETMSMQRFARLSLTSGIPDRTTIMNFRHLLERHQLGRQIFDSINEWLSNAGVITLLMPRLSTHQPPRRIGRSNVRRCIRPRKAINGILA